MASAPAAGHNTAPRQAWQGGEPALSEREPPRQFEVGRRTWEAAALGRALDAAPAEQQDVAHGDGARFGVGADQPLQLEVYPDARVVRLTGPAARLELYRQEPPEILQQSILFERQERAPDERIVGLALSASGETTFYISPDPASLETSLAPQNGPDAPPPPPGSPSLPQPPETPARDDARPSQHHAENPSPSGKRPDQNEQERLTLRGRVGAAPAFRSTRNGVVVAQFPLGVPHEDDTTSWHTVVAFNERAQKLKGSLKKGQAVEVVGYLHTKEQHGKDGKPKRVEELYAVVIKQR